MSIFEAIIQGIVQGLTEFLPVSSSGHLVLSQHVLGVKGNNLFFDVMLHLGTLIAVLAVYYKLVIRLLFAFFSIIRDIFKGNFKWKNLNHDKRLVIMLIIGLLPLFLLFLHIPGTDLSFKDLSEEFANSGNLIIVGLSLIATSILLTLGIFANKKIVINLKHKKSHMPKDPGRKYFNIIDSILVGTMQCLAAIFPGLSRSGSTLSVGLLRGISKQTALDYSFVLGIPSILAAALVEFKEVAKTGDFNMGIAPVIVGVIVSAIVGFLAIKLFKWLLATDKTWIFIVYTAICGILTIIIHFIEKINNVNIFTNLPV